jgi:hypothetical protein
VMNRFLQLSLLLSVVALAAPVCPANADQFKLPEEIGRIEAPRDTNIFQVEPTVINENYYNSGADERHQNIGTTLPEGAPIPDTDYPVPVVPANAPAPAVAPTPKPTATVPPMITPVSAKGHKGRYNSGAAERHQFIGNTLPAGAAIPDTDWTVSVVPAVAPVAAAAVTPGVVPVPKPSASAH